MGEWEEEGVMEGRGREGGRDKGMGGRRSEEGDRGREKRRMAGLLSSYICADAGYLRASYPP